MRNSAILLLTTAILIALTSCGFGGTQPTAIPTLEVPTPTMEPLAALVNGEGITIVAYQAELDRYAAALNESNTTNPVGVEPKTIILNELVNTTLLAQAAYQTGFQISEVELDERLAQLAEQIGGVPAFQNWESRYGYTDSSLRESLKRSIASAWMRDKIINGVPLQAEQVHARQILLSDEQTALSIKAQLDSGVDFNGLAYEYDRITGGDLGWFPHGYLNFPEVESVAFTLEPGKFSDPVKSGIGWHIVLVIEKDPAHQLSPDALLFMQHQALNTWLTQRRSESTIEILI